MKANCLRVLSTKCLLWFCQKSEQLFNKILCFKWAKTVYVFTCKIIKFDGGFFFRIFFVQSTQIWNRLLGKSFHDFPNQFIYTLQKKKKKRRNSIRYIFHIRIKHICVHLFPYRGNRFLNTSEKCRKSSCWEHRLFEIHFIQQIDVKRSIQSMITSPFSIVKKKKRFCT